MSRATIINAAVCDKKPGMGVRERDPEYPYQKPAATTEADSFRTDTPRPPRTVKLKIDRQRLKRALGR